MAQPDEATDRSARWSQLLDLVSEHGRLSVAEASESLGVSAATVRRDFSSLAQQQLVTRTHGGVVATSVAYDLPARYRRGADSRRERIAAAVGAMPTPGQVVGLNGGRTSSGIARIIGARTDLDRTTEGPGLTVVTNALNIATELVLRPHIRTVSVGGVARAQSYELIGDLALATIDRLWLDVAVIGVNGIDVGAGMTCFHDGEAAVSNRFVERSDRVIIAADSSKLGVRTFARICDIGQANLLVTDDDASDKDISALEAEGLEVLAV
ncbi:MULTISPECIES: DeoR/GlpR family DNA-binding transcription regulator [unclassified Janibacter]|uniref:DeoR/GlpR family DNA-binding transcription regulator n=1 Tax=unclassified Janibacter TaxID=2649294 RepID=UPI003D05C10C